ncbi:MAG TPA: hypothetical protein VEG66_01095 [Thermoplasmata archaeon]|jgi:hypothetical protein|nr:hypothetical protein [Thermoplasmata archaeon]
MAAPGTADLLLFVAGIPGEAEEPELHSSIVRWFLGTNAEVRFARWRRDRKQRSSESAVSAEPLASDESPWHLPREVVASVELVCDAASRAGKHVTLVDVNRPGMHQELVQRWVGGNDVFPLLVRPDGSRLEGIENFNPHHLRAFVTGA